MLYVLFYYDDHTEILHEVISFWHCSWAKNQLFVKWYLTQAAFKILQILFFRDPDTKVWSCLDYCLLILLICMNKHLNVAATIQICRFCLSLLRNLAVVHGYFLFCVTIDVWPLFKQICLSCLIGAICLCVDFGGSCDTWWSISSSSSCSPSSRLPPLLSAP